MHTIGRCTFVWIMLYVDVLGGISLPVFVCIKMCTIWAYLFNVFRVLIHLTMADCVIISKGTFSLSTVF